MYVQNGDLSFSSIQHVSNWDSDEANMKNVFRKVSVVALDQGKISREECEKYFMSGNELLLLPNY